MATALTGYLQSATASSTVSTANKLLENVSTGGTLTNKNSNLTSGTTGWIEMWSQGNASAQTGAGSEPAPDARGWLDDGVTLEGNQFASGTWTATIQLETTVAGTFTCDIHVRAYQRSSGGTYTLIAEMVSAGQSVVNTAFTTYTVSATGVAASNTFAVGDKLYCDILLSIGVNGTTGNMRLEESSSGTLGNVNAQIVTPGYQSITVNTMSSTDALTADDSATLFIDSALPLDALTGSDIGGLQAWNIDALTAADTTLYVDSNKPVDALTATDVVNATVQASAVEALTTSDSVAKVDVYLVSDANTASDIGGLQGWGIDALSVADSTLNTDALIPVEALTVSDVMAQVDGYATLEALTVSDVTNATDAAALVDANSVNDIGGMQTWNVDALSAADVLAGTDAGNFAESNAVSDSLAQSDGYQVSDALTANDASVQADSYAVIDAQSISDSLALSDTYLASDVQSVVDALLGIDDSLYSDLLPLTDIGTMVESGTGPTTTEYDFTDALSGNDLFVGGGVLVVSDGNATSDSLALAMQYMALDALTLADLLAQSVNYQVINAQSVADLFASVGTMIALDSSAIADFFVQIAQYTALDALNVADSTVFLYFFPAIDANSVSDALLSADVAAWLDQVAISDSAVLSGGLVASDTLPISDQSGVIIVVIPVEALSITDQLVASRVILDWIDSLSISDLFAYTSSFPLEQTSAIVVAIGRSGNVVAIGRSGTATKAQGR